MILIQGKGVSAGVEHGPIYFYHRTDAAVVKRPAQDLEQEKRRLAEAQEKTKAQLEVLAKKCRRPPSSLRPTPCLWTMRTIWPPS